ncbi:MAG: hypothetical protein V3V33_08165 [Candidatus Lokiarchaeia archaeon]
MTLKKKNKKLIEYLIKIDIMKPPICRVCDKKLKDLNKGGLVYFTKRPSDIEWEKRMEEIGGVGHPPYAEWFCKKHYDKANELKNLTIDKALKILMLEGS